MSKPLFEEGDKVIYEGPAVGIENPCEIVAVIEYDGTRQLYEVMDSSEFYYTFYARESMLRKENTDG